MPFYEVDGDTPARVVLEQTGPTTFRVVEPFRYVDAVTGEQFVVPDPRWGDAETDLASVPGILLWFVPRYGQHTLPALLHDQLVDHDLADRREKADRIFRDAMGEQGVRFLRRWLMWTAVSLATMVRDRRWPLGPIVAWLRCLRRARVPAHAAVRRLAGLGLRDAGAYPVVAGAQLRAASGRRSWPLPWRRRYLAGRDERVRRVPVRRAADGRGARPRRVLVAGVGAAAVRHPQGRAPAARRAAAGAGRGPRHPGTVTP